MKRLNILFLLLCCLVMSTATAQRSYVSDNSSEPPFKPEYFAVGMRIGMGMSNIRGLDKVKIPGLNRDILPYSTSSFFNADVGFTGQVMFYNHMLIQLDLSIVSIGVAIHDEEYSRDMGGTNFHTRLLIGSKLGIDRIENLNFVFGAGPFLGTAFGRGSGDIYYSDYIDYISMSELHLKMVDYGLSAMVGLEYYGFQLSAHYDHGLRNLAYDGEMKTSGFHFAIGYILAFD